MRERWRSWLVLVALAAVVGGGALAFAAGARRTDSAFPRFLAAENAADAYVYATTALDPASVRDLPQVADLATMVGLPLSDPDVSAAVLTDERYGRDINGFKMVEGRRLAPSAADEAVVGFLYAQHFHVHPGSTITIRGLTDTSFRVVGVEAAPGEFPPRSATANLPVYLSPAFLETPTGRQIAPQGGNGYEVISVRLRAGASVDDFSAATRPLSDGFRGVQSANDQTGEVERAARAQAVVLRFVAILLALAGALVLGQLLVRDSMDEQQRHGALRALGFTTAQLRLAYAVRSLAVGVAGAVGAVVIAFFASSLFPLGTSRIAEPDPGRAFDWKVLWPGVVATIAVVAALGLLAFESGRRRATTSGRRSAAVDALHRAPLPVVAAVGTKLALETGGGSRALPVRATIVAATVAIATITAALTIGSSLHHLLDTPLLYGVTYDAHLEATGTFAAVEPYVAAVQSDPDVAEVAVSSTGVPLESGGVTFGAVAVTGAADVLAPTILSGRLPTAADEIALGLRTMSDLHTHIGEMVPIGVSGIAGPQPMRVVGRAVIAPINDTQRLGRGAIVAPSALDAFAATAVAGFEAPPPGDAFIRFRPGVDAGAGIAELRRRLDGADATVTAPDRPNDVATFGEVGNLPSVLAALFGVIAALAIVHLLVSSVRRRRRDLAVLKALGFSPRQLRAAVAWQATTVTLAALFAGLPLGVIGGRSLWAILSSRVGVVARPTVPSLLVALLVPAALLVANLAAAGPAVSAGRTSAALVLRAD